MMRFAVTSLPCWGRVVNGSLIDYQSIGAGSNPVASTTALAQVIRSVGNGQEKIFSYASEGLEKSRPSPLTSRIFGNQTASLPFRNIH